MESYYKGSSRCVPSVEQYRMIESGINLTCGGAVAEATKYTINTPDVFF